MKIAAIIQARMESTRLPGKIMKEIKGKSLLEHQIERIRKSKKIDQIIIATSVKESEQPIVALCEKLRIPYFRGSEQDVLERYYETAKHYGVDVVVRLTSDCPIIDPVVIDAIVYKYLELSSVTSYVSNTIERSFPRGLDVEVFSFEALEKAHITATLEAEREHVTAYMYSNKSDIKVANFKGEFDYSNNRWTVDTSDDFKLIELIINELYNPAEIFLLADVIALLMENPDWKKINNHVEQKKL